MRHFVQDELIPSDHSLLNNLEAMVGFVNAPNNSIETTTNVRKLLRKLREMILIFTSLNNSVIVCH